MALLPGLELLRWPKVAQLAGLELLRLQAMVWCLAARSSRQGLKQHGAGTMAGGSNRDCLSGCPSFLHRAEPGFSIRIDTSRESKKANEKTKYIYVCQKAGVNKKEKVADDGPITEKKIVRQRRKDYVDRMHCPARMIVRKTSPGHWEVVNFEREHNHERLRKFSLTKYMKSHRDIPAEEKEFIKLLHGCCITTTRAYQIMVELCGGIENCPYTEGDAKNLRVEYRAEYRGKDVKATLEYFEELKKEDPEFYYSYTLDEFDRVENLFWVDGAARRAYELYSDCLSFDTTYLTNAYNMPCAPFKGIDRNGITIQLGCGFLRNEKTEGFVWLFTKFKKAMDGKDPANIITDQDIAMKAAIGEVFVSSVHRNCRWHIMENARKTMGAFLDSKGDGSYVAGAKIGDPPITKK
ncbi:protein FAR1-RELATED SEQUENCE 5-like [Panicum virgatum]|uniref:protein FAR1-RELATED SEQUENCE 5-like n=1 Tax=Panicum virgatum TaxID=38727 RepID=UPI0019D509C6|nr:protein FAR1-RELATED SEQUENCE 5-like [Panicum virgatum]